MNDMIRFTEYREYIEKYLSDWYTRFHDLPQKPIFGAMEYPLPSNHLMMIKLHHNRKNTSRSVSAIS